MQRFSSTILNVFQNAPGQVLAFIGEHPVMASGAALLVATSTIAVARQFYKITR